MCSRNARSGSPIQATLLEREQAGELGMITYVFIPIYFYWLLPY